MKIIKDKKKLLKKAENGFYNENIDSIEGILEAITYKYDIEEPNIIDVKIGYDELEVKLVDSVNDTRVYKVIFSTDKHMPIFVSMSGKIYKDVFKIYKNGCIELISSVYKSNKALIERFYLDDESYVETEKYLQDTIQYMGKTIREDLEVSYRSYTFSFKNKDLNSLFRIEIPETHPFIESLFINGILNSKEEINDIDTLFLVIKKELSCSKAFIRVENKNYRGVEVFNYEVGKLIEYKRIKEDEIIEYNDTFNKVYITKFESDTLDNEEFQKVLKIVRS